MTESVNVGREGRYTIGLIDEDRIKHIKAMNTKRDTYNQSTRVRRLPFSPQLFSTLLTYVSFGFAGIIFWMPICYMSAWSYALLPRPHFDATSWLSYNRITF